MTAGASLAVYALVAFALGALPFALFAGRLRGIDLRRHGSGNLGATNVLRVMGPRWGVPTLLLDVGKGWVAVALAPAWFGLSGVGQGSLVPLLGCLAAVLGHIFTPLARFRGGKGVATTLGGFLALSPLAALAGIAGFVATVTLSRYVSLGSLVMAVIFPLATIWWGPRPPLRIAAIGLGVLLALMLAWRHRQNWRRIAAGTESRFRWRKADG